MMVGRASRPWRRGARFWRPRSGRRAPGRISGLGGTHSNGPIGSVGAGNLLAVSGDRFVVGYARLLRARSRGYRSDSLHGHWYAGCDPVATGLGHPASRSVRQSGRLSATRGAGAQRIGPHRRRAPCVSRDRTARDGRSRDARRRQIEYRRWHQPDRRGRRRHRYRGHLQAAACGPCSCGNFGVATDLNEFGQIVGARNTTRNPFARATLWTPTEGQLVSEAKSRSREDQR
jgi:hypothetical protein